MPHVLSVTEAQILAALRSFLLSVLPDGTEVVRAQMNHVPQPRDGDYVVMTPLVRPRLSTNHDDPADVFFVGAIADAILTVTAVEFGSLRVGGLVSGIGATPGTVIVGCGTGTGGVGTYDIWPPQTVSSRSLSGGALAVTTPTEVVVQLDVYGPAAADHAQAVATLFRDEWACQALARTGLPIAPLHAGDPRQVPFVNAERRYEQRWTLDVALQANPTVTVPQQFAEQLAVTLQPPF